MKYKHELAQARLALEQSHTEVPFALKTKMAELMLDLMRRRTKFGMFVILGWKPEWQSYAVTPDASQDVFIQRRANIIKMSLRPEEDHIVNTRNFDGAILVDGNGNILRSGVMIEGLRPSATANELHPHRTGDLSTRFGFRRKVHVRQLAAITSSYLFKGTTIFTISEETGDLHIFENGLIVHSTVPGE
jgi:DNA integrity scanning protein DisA with diadenylate cyclase activity